MNWSLPVGAVFAATATWLCLTQPLWPTVGALAAMACAVMTFQNPKRGLQLLIFSMMLSPEFSAGQAGSRPITIRYDDVVLLTVFLAWLARITIRKDLPLTRFTPVHLPIVFYVFVCVLSTGLGILRGDLAPLKAVFFTLKYIQYFAVFFMAVNLLESDEDLWTTLLCGLAAALLVTAYAYNYHYQTGDRTTTPFDDGLYGLRTTSEPGTLGAYYIVVFSTALGVATEISAGGLFTIFGLLAIMFPAFLQTLSRASYLGMGVSTMAVLLLARSRRFLIASVAAAVCALALLSPAIRQETASRIDVTFHGGKNRILHEVKILGFPMELEDSAAQRVWAWERILNKHFPEHPALGHGITGIGFEDTQYGTILGELGLVGLFIFGWIAASLFGLGARVRREADQAWVRGLAIGFMAALAGLLTHAFTSNTFIIIKVMEPFWLLAAMVAARAVSLKTGTTA